MKLQLSVCWQLLDHSSGFLSGEVLHLLENSIAAQYLFFRFNFYNAAVYTVIPLWLKFAPKIVWEKPFEVLCFLRQFLSLLIRETSHFLICYVFTFLQNGYTATESKQFFNPKLVLLRTFKASGLKILSQDFFQYLILKILPEGNISISQNLMMCVQCCDLCNWQSDWASYFTL